MKGSRPYVVVVASKILVHYRFLCYGIVYLDVAFTLRYAQHQGSQLNLMTDRVRDILVNGCYEVIKPEVEATWKAQYNRYPKRRK